MSAAVENLRGLDPVSSKARDARFAVGLAIAMLAINLIGFGPTLYFRPFFDAPPIPVYLYIHGILGTAWFALLLTQAMLIRNRSFAQHRRLGWIAITLAAAVLLFGIYTSTNLVPRNLALGDLSAQQVALFSAVTAADMASFIYFPTLIALAVWYRKRMDVHMRLLFMASLGITGPASARIASWFGEIPNPVLTIITLSIVGALVVHDIRTRGRPHWATIFGFLLVTGLTLGLRFAGVGSAIVAARIEGG
jgi:phosphate starvation-inducible membrane PsiE